MKWVCEDRYLQMFGHKLNKCEYNLHSLEVVGHGNETQLQVGENLNMRT